MSDNRYRRPEIIVLKLPTITSLTEDAIQTRYFTYLEAKELYKNEVDHLNSLEDLIKKQENEHHQDHVNVWLSGIGTEPAKNFTYYFIDPRNCQHTDSPDVITAASCIPEFVKQITKDLYGVNAEIENLIFSPHYLSIKNDPASIPAFLKALINQSLLKALNALSEHELNMVKKTKVYYINPTADDNEEKVLWMNTLPATDSVFISPFLVRAAYFYALNRTVLFRPLLASFNTIQFGETSVWESSATKFIRLHKPEVKEATREIINSFVDNFTLVIAHELGHTYLDTTGHSPTEIQCDCNASKRLRSKYGKLNLGIYNAIFQASIKKKLYKYWGVASETNFETRFQFMNRFQNEEIDCQSIVSGL